MYFTSEIMEWIVQKTNNHIRDAEDHSNPYARPLLWYPTTAGELYVYFAIRIYMTYNIQHEISDYWSDKEFLAHHDITQYMSRDRFQELHMRVRLAGNEASGPYQRVDKLSEHVQDVNLSVYVPGRDVAVDEYFKDLLELKKSDKNDVIPWGTLYAFPTTDGKSQQIGWKDQAFVLFMTSVLSAEETIERNRKRPKETSSKAKTSRAVFDKGEAVKKLAIPIVADQYNYNMGAVDEGDHLIAQKPGLREVRRGGHQAIEHWILRLILVNSYLLAERSEVEEPRQLTFRSQQEFRRILVKGLISKSKETLYRSPKKRVSIVSQKADLRPPHLHQQVKMAKKGWCVACKGGRFSDRQTKRVALSEISVNKGRSYAKKQSIFGCQQCDIHLFLKIFKVFFKRI
ncbi:hypothetical protein DL98DRAFT_578195, partial [Cadophora sp. DSE1049]